VGLQPLSAKKQSASDMILPQREKKKSSLVAISSRNARSLHDKAVTTIQLETPRSASLWDFAALYLCFIPTYWE